MNVDDRSGLAAEKPDPAPHRRKAHGIVGDNEGRYVGDVGGNGRNPVGCRQCEHKKPHDKILGSGKTGRARHPTTQHQGVRNVLMDVDTLVS